MIQVNANVSKQLDSVRGASALIVIFGHANQIFLTSIHASTAFVGLFTQFAVMVFFVLSGYLIGASIYKNIETNRFFSLAEYFKSRAMRIYPPLLFASVLTVTLCLAAPFFFPSGSNLFLESELYLARAGLSTRGIEVLGSVLFLNGFRLPGPNPNGPLWSLSFEVWYYIIAAGLFLLPKRKWVGVAVLLVAIYVTKKNLQFYFLGIVWFSGLLLAALHGRQSGGSSVWVKYAFWILCFSAFLLGIAVLFFPPLETRIISWLTLFMIASGLAFTCILAMVLRGEICVPTWFAGASIYSYTLYIVHFPIMLFLFGVFQAHIESSLFVALVVSGLAIFTCIVISSRLAYWLENKKKIERVISALCERLPPSWIKWASRS